MGAKRFWTDGEVAELRKLFPHASTADVAATLGRNYRQVSNKAHGLGLCKTPAFLASSLAKRLDGSSGEAHRFKAGHSTWNKGVRGVVGVQDACRAHQFKPGRPAHEAANYQPIGTLRICRDGCLQRKATDDPRIPAQRRWVPVHREAWEAAHGPIPSGLVVVFKPGRKTVVLDEITADALECLSREQLMKRNSVHTNYPPEVARLVQLTGAIKRQINKRARHEQNNQ